jgi:hypothetical protein
MRDMVERERKERVEIGWGFFIYPFWGWHVDSSSITFCCLLSVQ